MSPGFTMFNGVYEVKPAHYLIWKAGKPVTEKPYWSLSDLVHQNKTYTDDDLRNALNDATRKRLVADVEVGGFCLAVSTHPLSVPLRSL